MYLYLSENPRTLYLVTSSQDEIRGCPARALVFRAAQGSSSQAVVEFLPKDQVDLSNAVKLTSRVVKGCLGLISIANGTSPPPVVPLRSTHANQRTDMFLAVIVSATEVGNVRPSSPTPEAVAQIHDVGFYCLTSSLWDDLSLTGDPLAAPGFGDNSDTYMREHGSGTATPAPEHPCQPLRKIISAGTFYYAMEPQWDISSRLQRRLSRSERWDASSYDDRFVWNEYIVKSLLDFRERLDAHERAELDQCQFIVR